MFKSDAGIPTTDYSLPVALWVDASVLLHDFMHRHPEVAAQRNVVPAQAEPLAAYRRRVHAALVQLADKGCQVNTTSAVLWRLAAVLSEWYLPALYIKVELQYLMSNYHVHDLGAQELELVISSMGTEPALGVDEMGWLNLGVKTGIKSLLTCLPLEEELWQGWCLLKPENVASGEKY